MTVVIIISLIAIVLIAKFFLDRDKMLQQQVDSEGGMKNKYKVLIDELSDGMPPQFVEVTRDHIYFRFVGDPTVINYYITEHFGSKVEVEWVLQLGVLGNEKLKWSFPSTMSQQKMSEKIYSDIKTKMENLSY